MIEILPSILVGTKIEFEEKVRIVEPHCERAHLDIADGIFVPNKTIDGFLELEQIETELLFTVHLMVSKPENHIARWLEIPRGVEGIVFHAEATQKHIEVINLIKEGDCEAGIALNPIRVDGAVTPETAPRLIEAGATSLVVGHYLFLGKSLEEQLAQLKMQISK